MKNTAIKSILVGFVAFIALLSSAYSVVRENDEVTIQTPIENEALMGIAKLSWLIKDTDQSTIPTQLDLFSLSCSSNGDYYATITDNVSTFKKAGYVYSYDWNTMDQLKNKPVVDDGDYCLRICGTLLRDKNYYYSLCDTRTISVENNNRRPQILSTPSKLDYKVGEEFAYQINAYDADDDTLTFTKLTGPSFINVNMSTGLVKSSTALSEIGSYTVKVRVTDEKGAYVEQVFTINVIAQDATSYDLTIISPKDKDVVKTSSINIRWTISTTSGVSGYRIYYSKDAETWEKIADVEANKALYLWDLENIKSGNYYIKVEARLSEGGSINAVSGKFSVDKSGGSVPLIKSVKPAEDSTITDNKPYIQAVFSITSGATVNKSQTSISLDDNNLPDCTKTDNSISCTLSTELASGKHKAKLVVIDSLNKSNTKEWFFTVSTGGATDNTNGGATGTVDWEQIKQVGIYVCCGLLALAVPLVLILIVRRVLRNRREAEANAAFSAGAPSEPVVTTNYYPVDQATASQVPASQESVYTPTLTYDAPDQTQVQMPSSYTSDEIPDWLKTTGGDKPISISGGEFTLTPPEDTSGGVDDVARPHE